MRSGGSFATLLVELTLLVVDGRDDSFGWVGGMHVALSTLADCVRTM
jgi:hypothetical protein